MRTYKVRKTLQTRERKRAARKRRKKEKTTIILATLPSPPRAAMSLLESIGFGPFGWAADSKANIPKPRAAPDWRRSVSRWAHAPNGEREKKRRLRQMAKQKVD